MERSGKSRQRIVLLLANVFSVACLWWVLHNLDWREFKGDVRQIHWLWVLVAVVADILVYVWQGWRWSLLLTPVEAIPISRSVRAIYVGLFANEVLPLKTGEIIRCYLQARWSSIPFSVTVSSAIIERIFDGFALLICLFVTLKRVPGLSRYIGYAGYGLASLLIVLAAVLGIAMFHKQRAQSALSSEGRIHRHMRVLIEDLYVIGHSRYLYFSALVTIPHLLMQVVPYYAFMRAYDFGDASWGVAAVLMVVLRLGAAVPQAPGNLGAFQALAVIVLADGFNYDRGFVTGFSLIMWIVVTLPLLVAGFIALAFTGMHLGELTRKAKSEMPRSTG